MSREFKFVSFQRNMEPE